MGDSKQKPNPNWYSRRHETNEAQTAAREAYARRAEGRPLQEWNAEAECWVKVG